MGAAEARGAEGIAAGGVVEEGDEGLGAEVGEAGIAGGGLGELLPCGGRVGVLPLLELAEEVLDAGLDGLARRARR